MPSHSSVACSELRLPKNNAFNTAGSGSKWRTARRHAQAAIAACALVSAASAAFAQGSPLLVKDPSTVTAVPTDALAPDLSLSSPDDPISLAALGSRGAPLSFQPPWAIFSGHRILPPPSTATRRPDLFAPQTLYPLRNNILYQGEIDLQYRTRTTNHANVDQTVGSYIPASRLTVEYVRANPDTGTERGGARVQLLLENDNQGTALNKLRASELYGFYHFPFPGVSATIRGGQFVLPFGLAAVYDTPLQPIQPLYEQSVGLRVDTGVMLEGEYGLYHYAGSLTTGTGPDRTYGERGHVVAFRLARAVETRLGNFQVGGSLLSGTLPVTTFDYQLPPSGFVGTRDYVNKSRFAGDGEYFIGHLIARAEAEFGADNQESVWGYFGEADYEFVRRLQAVAYIKHWAFPVNPQAMSALGTGLNYGLGGGLMLRSLFEYERDVPATGGPTPTVIRRITLQTDLRF